MVRRPILSSRVLDRLGDTFWPDSVDIQAPTEVRDSVGGVSFTWAGVTDLVDLRGRLGVATVGYQKGEVPSVVTKAPVVALKGYYPSITTLMRAMINGLAYEIVGVTTANSMLTRLDLAKVTPEPLDE